MATYNTGELDLNPGDFVDLQADARGGLKLGNEAGIPAGAATYCVSFTGYTAYATPTDLFILNGSATKTVVVRTFTLYMQSTSAAAQVIDIIKRSTANTGGTSTTPTPIAYDSTQAAATAVLRLYTAAPTTGTAVGTLRTLPGVSATLTTGPNPYGLGGLAEGFPYPRQIVEIGRPIILRGVAEGLAYNYKGAALTAGFTATGIIEWVEF